MHKRRTIERFVELKVRKCNLKSRDIGGEAVDAEHHLPRSLPLSTPRTASNFAIVLSDSTFRVHCESEIPNNSSL